MGSYLIDRGIFLLIFFGLSCIFLLSPILGCSSSMWFKFWVIIEALTLSFIFLNVLNETFFNKEKILKFFIVQSIASIFILIPFSLKQDEKFNFFLVFILIISFILKIGIVPLHFWLPEFGKTLPWHPLLVLLTWMKLMPIYILSIRTLKLIFFFSICSVFYATFSQVSLNNRKLILIFSSITQMSWILMLITLNKKIRMLFIGLYWLVLLFIFIEFFKVNFLFLNNPKKFKNKSSLIVGILNLAGIPPLLGFFIKWISLFVFFICKPVLVFISFLRISIINVFIYLRFCYLYLITIINLDKFKNGIVLDKTNKIFYFFVFLFPALVFFI